MTPRTVVRAHQQDESIASLVGDGRELPFARMPLFKDSLDDADGFVLRADALLAMAESRGDNTLASIKRELPTIPADTSLAKLLEFLLNDRQHIALVVGEYGATIGLVTLEDVVETLLGIEIVDELDTVEDMQSLARQRWEARAKARGISMDQFNGAKSAD
jgi:CBS domain containing-hemolysin-like protein